MKDRNDDFKTLKQYCFRELRLSGRDVEILRLCAGKNTVPGDLSSFFETVVFNELQGQQACALASLGQRMDFRGVPEALLPRLKGVIRYNSLRDAVQMEELFCLLKRLNGADAEVMLLNGAAMKAHYLPHAVRYPGGISFRIRRDRLENAVRALEETGEYTVSPGASQMEIVRNRQTPRVQFSCRNGVDSEADCDGDIFWEDAVEAAFQGERVFIPSREALLFQILSDVFRAVLEGTDHRQGRIQWAQDCAYLIGENGFRWGKLRELCAWLDASVGILAMLQVLADLIPDLVPEEAFSCLAMSAAEKERIPLYLRYIRAREKLGFYAQNAAGQKKSLRYGLDRLRFYWYRNRCRGKRSGLAADALSFPSCLRSSLRAGTWKEFIRVLSAKMRGTI